jgi:hypothetical protein
MPSPTATDPPPSPLAALAHRLATTAAVVVAFLVVVVGLVPLLHRLVDAYGQHRLSDALFANDLKGAQRALKQLYTTRGLFYLFLGLMYLGFVVYDYVRTPEAKRRWSRVQTVEVVVAAGVCVWGGLLVGWGR